MRIVVYAARLERLIPAAVAAGALVCSGPLANAQVMQLGEHGSVTIFDTPAVFGTAGSTPIVLRKPIRSRARSVRLKVASQIAEAASASELSPALVQAVAEQESGLRSGLISRTGAVGEMQLMPATARALGVDAHDSDQNYRGGAAYLRTLLARYDGDVVRALSAYNAGSGAVDRYGGTPPYRETQAYVAAVLERLSLQAERGGGR